MPEKDGLETVKEILAIDPTAIIFTMSGKDDTRHHNEVDSMMRVPGSADQDHLCRPVE